MLKAGFSAPLHRRVYPCVLKYAHRYAPVVFAAENGKIVR
jgi:hypothetical protein